MKKNKPTFEGKSVTSWGWFLGTFAFVILFGVIVFATPLVDMWMEAASESATARMVPIIVFLAVVAFGAHKADSTK